MSKQRTVTGRVIATRHDGLSRSGNPRYTVVVDSPAAGVLILVTAPNVSLAYEIDNPEYRDTAHVFTLNARGQIVDARPVAE